jgi:hypothetical protein
MYDNDVELIPLNKTDSPGKRRHTGAGILIVTSINKKPYLLLGKENYKSFKLSDDTTIPVYEEFGGGIQSRKCSLEENALKELDEETAHILGWSDPRVLLRKGFVHLDIPFLVNRMYRLYIIYVPNVINVMPTFFKNRQTIFEHTSTYYKRDNYIEMDDLQLISLEIISSSMKNNNNIINLPDEDRILKLDDDTGFLSRRIFSVLKETHTVSDKKKTGLQCCYQVFNTFNNNNNNLRPIILDKPENNYKHKYNFLRNTINYDAT